MKFLIDSSRSVYNCTHDIREQNRDPVLGDAIYLNANENTVVSTSRDIEYIKLIYSPVDSNLLNEGFPKLKYFSAFDDRMTGSLEFLRYSSDLKYLDMILNRKTTSLEPIKNCTNLKHLNLPSTINLNANSLLYIKNCTNLQFLSLGTIYKFKYTEIISRFADLRILHLGRGYHCKSLDPLKSLKKLVQIKINCYDVTDFSALKSLDHVYDIELSSISDSVTDKIKKMNIGGMFKCCGGIRIMR